MPDTIGFIGLGIMGKPMAHNLLKAGFAVIVHNRHQEVTDELVAAGALAGARPQEIAASCDVLITMLADAPQVEEVELKLIRSSPARHFSSNHLCPLP